MQISALQSPRWVNLSQEKLFLQGDDEKAAGLKVSPMMARNGKGSKMRSSNRTILPAARRGPHGYGGNIA